MLTPVSGAGLLPITSRHRPDATLTTAEPVAAEAETVLSTVTAVTPRTAVRAAISTRLRPADANTRICPSIDSDDHDAGHAIPLRRPVRARRVGDRPRAWPVPGVWPGPRVWVRPLYRAASWRASRRPWPSG